MGMTTTAPATVTVENDADFGASYPQNIGDVIADNQSLSRNNPQATKITSPAVDIIVTVGEDSDISACQGLFGMDCFGQGSLINVGNGQPFSQGFKVEISFNQNKPGADFVHFFDNGQYEDITTTCNADHSNAPVQDCDDRERQDLRHPVAASRTARPSATDRPLGGVRTHEAGAQAPASALSRDSSWATVTTSPFVR